MIKGINHLCYSVQDLKTSLAFYKALFDADVHVVGRTTAYLTGGGVWIALNEERNADRSGLRSSYTHTAFSADEEDLAVIRARLKQMGQKPLEGRTRSERDKASVYVEDPDGHKLEFHTGSLQERLAYYKEAKPHMTFLETKSVVRVVEETGSREAYIDDLMMADESREAVEAYLHKGKLFRIEADGNVAGVLLLVSAAEESMEIVNMALRPAYRGKGLGREAVEQVAAYCSSIGISRLIVGTANSSIGNLAFYQRTGFRMYDILQAYFDHYPEPFYENGIRGRDMVMLERFL